MTQNINRGNPGSTHSHAPATHKTETGAETFTQTDTQTSTQSSGQVKKVEPNIPAKLLSPYDPATTEPLVIQAHETSGLANPDTCIKIGLTSENQPAFSIVLPPPNVTGTLHLGHGLMATLQDISIRFERMRGKRVLWIPGTDHAAIATQSKVEKDILKKEGKNRYDIGREEMLKRIGDFAQESRNTIVSQIKRMGASLDWTREAFTLDDARNKAVRTMFKNMYDDGLIYKGFRIVNWDPKGQTTIADDEIIYKEEKTKFYYFKYGPFIIGTARPETKFADKYVVMHPDDARYSKYEHGQKLTVEWINGPIEATIIKDSSIDMEFGTGVMTITPWHSKVDFDMAEKYNLDKEQIIDKYGKLLPVAGEFAGMKIAEAREKIVEKLQVKGLVEKIEENYVHNIATAERTGGVIEPQIMDQWFIAVNRPFTIKYSKIAGIKSGDRVTLKQIMYNTVNEGQIKIIPEHYNKTYFHWIENLNDWCISRQIWYGHRIPVWYKKVATPGSIDGQNQHVEMYCDTLSPKEAGRADADEFVQDEDTLDTWFSSGLWTFSTLGWPNAYDKETGFAKPGSDLSRFHPTNLLVTGPDILFFWVARMILMTGYGIGDIPFPAVYMNGIVRDMQGRKMSKSLGNGGDPIEISEKYGADALRMFYAMSTAPGTDSRLDENKIKGFKHFGNKLWNITRFILTATEGRKLNREFSAWSENDQKLIEERDEVLKTITTELSEYKYHLASEKLYQYVWSRFADVILEESKIVFNGRMANTEKGLEEISAGTPEDQNSRAQFLLDTLQKIVTVLHPFMPHVTEELWSILSTGKGVSERDMQGVKAVDLLMAHPWPVK